MFSSRYLLSWTYLLLAISGAILPTLANIDYVKEYGSFDISNFIYLANINPAAESLSRDLLVGAGAITIWIINESQKLKMKNMWLIYSSFLVAFAFAAPLFLFFRERHLIEMEKNGT
tara:strand:+ start:5834 stop:6184 length:351 start_codon:yes stop_codon:yes gene_type:complete